MYIKLNCFRQTYALLNLFYVILCQCINGMWFACILTFQHLEWRSDITMCQDVCVCVCVYHTHM